MKSTDLMRKCREDYHYNIDQNNSQMSPEDILIGIETANLAGEDFEFGLLQSQNSYHAPLNREEVIEHMCRRNAISNEEKLLHGTANKKQETAWKRRVRRRKKIIAEELPRKMRFYRRFDVKIQDQ